MQVPTRGLLSFLAEHGGPASASANVDANAEALARERFGSVGVSRRRQQYGLSGALQQR